MTCPLLYATKGCCDQFPKPGGIHSVMRCAALIDVLATLTCLVLGILGRLSIITIGPAASYALIGVSVSITLSWMVTILHQSCSDPEAE